MGKRRETVIFIILYAVFGIVIRKGERKLSLLYCDRFWSSGGCHLYLAQKTLWNAGIFAFKLGYLPEKAHSMFDFEDYRDLFNKYDTLTKIGFDYAVVEKEPSIQVLRYSGDWKDVGTRNMMAEVMADKTKGKAILDETCVNTNVVNELNIPILCMIQQD